MSKKDKREHTKGQEDIVARWNGFFERHPELRTPQADKDWHRYYDGIERRGNPWKGGNHETRDT